MWCRNFHNGLGGIVKEFGPVIPGDGVLPDIPIGERTF
jgi:hypothetical protein